MTFSIRSNTFDNRRIVVDFKEDNKNIDQIKCSFCHMDHGGLYILRNIVGQLNPIIIGVDEI